jgi:vacuolar-type H+-ATPase subunit I/STV1
MQFDEGGWKMSKTPSRVGAKATMLVCMFSLTCYAGSTVVSDTAAFFTSVEERAGKMTSAFVFPETMEALVKEVHSLGDVTLTDYNSMLATPTEGTLAEVEMKLKEVIQKQKMIAANQITLRKKLEEAEDYFERAKQEPQVIDSRDRIVKVIDYVKPAYVEIRRVHNDVKAKVDIKKMQALRNKLEKRIKELKEKPKPRQEEQIQSNNTENSKELEGSKLKAQPISSSDALQEGSASKAEGETQ